MVFRVISPVPNHRRVLVASQIGDLWTASMLECNRGGMSAAIPGVRDHQPGGDGDHVWNRLVASARMGQRLHGGMSRVDLYLLFTSVRTAVLPCVLALTLTVVTPYPFSSCHTVMHVARCYPPH